MTVDGCLGKEIKRKTYNDIELSLTQYSPNDVIDYHSHNTPYISMVLSGNYYETNESSEQLINKGDIISRPAFYLHQNKFTQETGLCFNIEFKNSFNNRIPNSRIFKESSPKEINNLRITTFQLLWNFINTNDDLIITKNLFDIIRTNIYDHNEISIPWMKRLITYLHNNWDRTLSLKELSEFACISPIYMIRAFKSIHGITIGEYQRRLRLNNTFPSLLDNSKSLTEIAFQSGFYDQSHMTRLFNQNVNLNPRKIRTALKKFI